MSSRGVIFKSCTRDLDGRPGRRRNRTCSRLTERGHGSWQFDCRVRDIRGRSTQVRRSGFPSQAAATRARDDMLVAADRLFAMWWLIALRGLRRGEAAGLRWCDVDLEHGTMTIAQQLTCIGHKILQRPPKSAASRRVVALDRHTVRALREHARRQRLERLAAGRAWQDTGYVFTRVDGRPLHPSYLTQRFLNICRSTDLPPIRLHDLRRGAASLARQAGADLKTVQDQLGHASIVLTADSYTSVLPESQRRAAAATAGLVLTAARAVRKQIKKRRNEYGDLGTRSAPLGAQERPANRETAGQAPTSRPNGPRKSRSEMKRAASNHRPHRTKR
ncbi:site-specific integrase [Dactylosporangium sp. NPDC050588]|uniref:site-specific integrase n=1 Tax=Dactylosporangium sp. NPDC050588 TaxID=3157211 RepID=UPI003410DEE7